MSLKPGFEIRPSALLGAILVTGLLAGLLTAAFHAVATEPIIEQAIALEEGHHAPQAAPAPEPAVSREVQRVGLFIGWGMLGLIYAALLGVAYTIARSRAWLGSGWLAPAALALAGYWATGLLPLLKYPANPPGVGDPDTIGARQAAWFACWALGIAGAAVSAAVASRLSLTMRARLGTGLLIYGVWSLGLFLLLPANPDAVTLAAALVDGFRIRSVAGLTLFWIVLGVSFAALSPRLDGPTASPRGI